MLERRGVAGCIFALFATSLVALVAIERNDVAIFDLALSTPMLVLSVAAIVAAACVLYRRYTRRHAPRARFPTLIVVNGGLSLAEDPVPEVDELIHMLDDAVVLSREVPVVSRLQAVELTGLLKEQIAAHGTEANPRQLTLTGTPPPLMTLADPASLSRVFQILIRNALSAGSRAMLRIDHGTSALVVHVDDNGFGLPKSEREAVFERAYHMEILPSQRSNHCAELVIARQIARAHDGDITVSASPEGGARFTLRLPLLLEQERTLQAAC
ncbi:HAMP domain-containing sensor histidine kinase [Hyphomicrobium sp. LHD-15]|uniref:sensor histidine kinase n=1 Tax=Hyphomicrobium sp. LHD-15 TaxID=3072142 RepID=UPI0028108449|nr:HAMP domain-containing sensor histidine kinase [Hyphomicrobium sp. LHD-15]MDQ8698176.1 HAMP domain-containing sensor histidine kinase [Hyphomicrobium sp. LHD-15]